MSSELETASPVNRARELKDVEIRTRDTEAAGYDQWLRRTRAATYASEAESRAVLAAIRVDAESRVLDAGCGTGRLSMALAPRVAQVVAVDYSPTSIAVLRRKLQDSGICNVRAIAADLNSLPLPGESFEAVVCVEVIQHIPTLELRRDAVRRLYEVLRPGGHLVVVVQAWNRMSDGDSGKEGYYGTGVYRYAFTPGELAALFGEARFTRVRIRGLLSLPRRLWRRLPVWVTRLEPFFACLPWSARISRYLIATARK